MGKFFRKSSLNCCVGLNISVLWVSEYYTLAGLEVFCLFLISLSSLMSTDIQVGVTIWKFNLYPNYEGSKIKLPMFLGVMELNLVADEVVSIDISYT